MQIVLPPEVEALVQRQLTVANTIVRSKSSLQASNSLNNSKTYTKDDYKNSNRTHLLAGKRPNAVKLLMVQLQWHKSAPTCTRATVLQKHDLGNLL
jgi:hypothetical protein